MDGGYVISAYKQENKEQLPSADQIINLAKSCLDHDDLLFRIFFYDCRPFDKELTFPGTGNKKDFSKSPEYTRRSILYSILSKKDNVAFRSGDLKFRGWGIGKGKINQLTTNTQTFSPSDLKPSFQQKGVDIKIGIDIASLSIKRIVDKIVLLTNDTDFIPAMKFARREGTQIALYSMTNQQVTPELKEHADFIRQVSFEDCSA